MLCILLRIQFKTILNFHWIFIEYELLTRQYSELPIPTPNTLPKLALGAIHKLRRQDFEDFLTSSSVDKFTT